MGIPQRMAVAMSSLVFAGAAVLTMGAAAPAGAASANAVPANAAPASVETTNTAQPTLRSSWCSRHPWKCRGFRHHHKFRHNRHGHHGWGGWGGQSVNIHNENINISSSHGHRW